MELSTEAGNFAYRLDFYRDLTRVPPAWFKHPDSVEITAESVTDFEQLVKNPKKEAVVHEITEDERFLVAAKVAGGLGIGRLGRIEWVEIEEPDEMKKIAELTGVKNMNFFYTEFEAAMNILGFRNIRYDLLDLEDHSQIRVTFDREGNSFSLINRPLASLITEKVEQQRAKIIEPKQNAS